MIAIAGAGLAGLACARVLGSRARVHERDDRTGGLCRTEVRGPYTIDHTGHYLHFKDPKMKALVAELLAGNLHAVRRSAWVTLNGRTGAYPFQANLHGHDPRVVRECVGGLFAAQEAADPGRRGESYAAWVRRTQGDGFLKWFMRPFNEKQFRAKLEDLLPIQSGRFLPRPDVAQIVRGALGAAQTRLGYNADLWHPRRGGIEELPKALARSLPVTPLTGDPLRSVDWRRRTADFGRSGRIGYDALVSTLPLPLLLDRLAPLPPAMRKVRNALRWIGVLCLHVCHRHARERERHWVYVPERKWSFYRYGFPANINPADAPKGRGIVSAEVSYAPGRRPDPAGALARAKRELIALGVVGRSGDIEHELAVDFPVAYVVMDRRYPAARQAALRWLAERNILSIGRFGGWVYGGMEDALIEGRNTGELIAAYGARAGARFARAVR